jgi:hypothetical protein
LSLALKSGKLISFRSLFRPLPQSGREPHLTVACGCQEFSELSKDRRLTALIVCPEATSTIIPAGHAASTAEGEVGEHRANASTGLAGLSVAALGVIFGDIGTSPVYTFRECFNPEHRLALDAAHVLGVLSLIF